MLRGLLVSERFHQIGELVADCAVTSPKGLTDGARLEPLWWKGFEQISESKVPSTGESHLPRTSNIALIAAFPTAMRRRIKTASSGHMCGKPATPPDDFGAAEKKIAVPAEPLKKLDVDRPGIRAGDMIAIPLPNIGSMGGECWPLPEGAIAEKAVPSNLLQMGVSS